MHDISARQLNTMLDWISGEWYVAVECHMCGLQFAFWLPLKTQDLSVGFDLRALTVGKQMSIARRSLWVRSKSEIGLLLESITYAHDSVIK